MVFPKQDEKLYSESVKLRGIHEVMDKLQETGIIEILNETMQNIHTKVPSSKNQMKVLCSMLIDEIWANKKKEKKEKKFLKDEDIQKSYTARSHFSGRSTEKCLIRSVISGKSNKSLLTVFFT